MIPKSGVLFPVLAATLWIAFLGANFNSSVVAFSLNHSTNRATINSTQKLKMASSSEATMASAPTWENLKARLSETAVGKALDRDVQLRKEGKGSPNVHSNLRLFNEQSSEQPVFTLFRDHAGWCPYFQKTMLLIEAKEIPINIELVNMRSYGDKPRSFLSKVPNGMLPALEDNRSGNVALDSAYIMEFLEQVHPSPDYKRMVPIQKEQPQDYQRYKYLMNLERELFRWWCTLVFRPEAPNPGTGGNPASAIMGKILGGGNSSGDDGDSYVSPSMRAFVECLETVDEQLGATKGPYFLDYTIDHPTMIDFVFASHVERMLASCAYWKGMDLRDSSQYPQLQNLRTWMEALEKHEYYLAFKSDYYTHVKDIPPQYGPSSSGVSRLAKIRANQADIEGSGTSWKLPLEDDEMLQPLFKGIPLPKCVLEAADIGADANGSYESSASSPAMKEACQIMAAWKLCGNGPAIANFASRGGPSGAKNVRKTFGAELADPYAKADESMVPFVDAALQIVAQAMLDGETNTIPDASFAQALLDATKGSSNSKGVAASLAYLRDRIGVPRDLPLASARYLRAYLNWAIDVLSNE